MGRIVRASIVGIMLLLVAPSAVAAPDRTMTLTAGQSATWTGTDTVGTNLRYWSNVSQLPGNFACSKAVDAYCETILIQFSKPVPENDADGKLSRIARITVAANNPASDYDVRVYRATRTDHEALGSGTPA